MIDRMVRQEIGRLLDNWALCNGRFTGVPVTSNGAGWGRDRTDGDTTAWQEVTHYITADAQRVDRALKQMTEHEREILVESYCVPGTQESNAKARKMVVRTYKRWLAKAEGSFWDVYRYKTVLAPIAPPVGSAPAEPI